MSTIDHVSDTIRSRVGSGGNAICSQFKGLTAKELFAWTRPVATGIVVGSIVAYLLIFSYFEYTFVLFVCRLLQVGFAALGGLAYTKKLTITTEDIRSTISKGTDEIKPIVANVADAFFRLLAWEQPGYSVPVLLGTIVIGFLSAYLEDAFLILALTIIAFGGTPLYIRFQKEIDPQVQKAATHIKKLISQIPIGKSKTA